MRKVRLFLNHIGKESIYLFLLLLLSIFFLCFRGDCNIVRDICLSLISAVIIYFITTVVPQYKQRKVKFIFYRDRLYNILEGGKIIFRNIYTTEELVCNPTIIDGIPSIDLINEACKKLDLRIAPSVYFYTVDETPSWDLLFNRYLLIIDNSIAEMVSIANNEDICTINICDKTRRVTRELQNRVSCILGSSANPLMEIKGDYICADLHKLADNLREIDKIYSYYS